MIYLILLKKILKINLTLLKDVINMSVEIIPEWFADLDDEDLNFIKKFILASGSLKEIANAYGVTYPTVRLKLDKIIQKIQVSDDTQNEPYVSLIKRLAINEKIDLNTAKILINEYKKVKKTEGN